MPELDGYSHELDDASSGFQNVDSDFREILTVTPPKPKPSPAQKAKSDWERKQEEAEFLKQFNVKPSPLPVEDISLTHDFEDLSSDIKAALRDPSPEVTIQPSQELFHKVLREYGWQHSSEVFGNHIYIHPNLVSDQVLIAKGGTDWGHRVVRGSAVSEVSSGKTPDTLKSYLKEFHL